MASGVFRADRGRVVHVLGSLAALVPGSAEQRIDLPEIPSMVGAFAERIRPQVTLLAHPDGRIYLAHRRHEGLFGGPMSRILRIEPDLPAWSTENVLVPSDDGRSVFEFLPSGRHFRTRDSLSGASLLEFTYDDDGRLERVDDVIDGSHLSMTRNAAGIVTEIRVDGELRMSLEMGPSTGPAVGPVADPANSDTGWLRTIWG